MTHDSDQGGGTGRIPALAHHLAVEAAATVGLPVGLCDLNIFRVLLHHPPLAKAVSDLLTGMILRGRLDHRLRELVIMRTGWRTGSVYEWAQHWRMAHGFGVSEEDLAGVRDWEHHASFGAADRAVLAATDEALTHGSVSAATWDRCAALVGGPDAMIELVAVIGAWQMVATFCNTVSVPLEAGVAPWPPEGRGPP